MNSLEERCANHLRRQIVLQRRTTLALHAEFDRLRAARAGAPVEARDGLLAELDAVAVRHQDAVAALDSLTDDLIRLHRTAEIRTPRWRRMWHAA